MSILALACNSYLDASQNLYFALIGKFVVNIDYSFSECNTSDSFHGMNNVLGYVHTRISLTSKFKRYDVLFAAINLLIFQLIIISVLHFHIHVSYYVTYFPHTKLFVLNGKTHARTRKSKTLRFNEWNKNRMP